MIDPAVIKNAVQEMLSKVDDCHSVHLTWDVCDNLGEVEGVLPNISVIREFPSPEVPFFDVREHVEQIMENVMSLVEDGYDVEVQWQEVKGPGLIYSVPDIKVTQPKAPSLFGFIFG